VRGEASVLHADLDAFYASVEQRDAPELRGRPVIVGGRVVLAASYEAKARGVRTAMGGRQALDLCPEAVIVPPRMEAYSAASRDVFAIFRDTTPLVEGLSIDEAFLEVGGLRHIAGTPQEVAIRLRARVRTEVGLAISVGVARTKFLAKVASAVSKPDGLLVVEPDREQAFCFHSRSRGCGAWAPSPQRSCTGSAYTPSENWPTSKPRRPNGCLAVRPARIFTRWRGCGIRDRSTPPGVAAPSARSGHSVEGRVSPRSFA